mgnify:CR=1 FL=1
MNRRQVVRRPSRAVQSAGYRLFASLLFALLSLPAILWCPRMNAETPSAVDAPTTVIHKVSLADPVDPSRPARVYDVVQARDGSGFPLEYRLSFETHVCVDDQCKPVEVTMFWNAVGCFERLKCPLGKPLTKKEHVPFTAQDYAKLDRILKDGNSILGSWAVSYLEKPVEAVGDVDAVTAPTPVTVKDSVIQDAAFTTWALWRWANGEIVPKLCGITEQSCTPAYLKHLLVSQERRYADFALDYAMEHHRTDPQFAESVFHLLETGERDQILRALEFLGHAVPDKPKLHARLIDSCCRVRPADAPLILEKLSEDPSLSANTLEGLAGRLARLPYFPIHLALRILEQRKFASQKTMSDVARLLDNADFFIARRAYEHLAKLELEADTRAKVDAFRQRYRDRL